MLEVQDLTKSYKGRVVVNDVSLACGPGEIYGVLGPSGSGKTTLLRLMAGLEMPDGGRILIEGEVVSTSKKIQPPSKRRLSLIFQSLALWPHMTARQNIEFVISGNGLAKKDIRDRADRALSRMHLEAHADRYPHQLSGGERQRLAIARALAGVPRYLLMDEPSANLDPLLIEELKEIILTLKRDFGMAVIYVTHDIGLALSLADKIAILNEGLIEQKGDREEVIKKPRSDFVRKFLDIGMAGKKYA